MTGKEVLKLYLAAHAAFNSSYDASLTSNVTTHWKSRIVIEELSDVLFPTVCSMCLYQSWILADSTTPEEFIRLAEHGDLTDLCDHLHV